MQRVGPYHIPFPYAPYPLQEHAMTALREFLESGGDGAQHPTPHSIEAINASETPSSTERAPSVKSAAAAVAVLESPTGTGKSQMLLNSILSFLFEPVYETDSKEVVEAGTTAAAAASRLPPGAAEEHRELLPNPPPPTLEEVLKQRQLDEEVDRLRQERKARVKAQRRQLRQARKMMQLQQQQQRGGGIAGEQFLLTQDPIAWYAEQPSAITVTSYSSSSSSSASSGEEDNAGDGDDVEGAVEGHLTTLVPLRKPKVYFASRTHTQLQQLMEDLQRTAFAQNPLRVRPQPVSSRSPSSCADRSCVTREPTESSLHRLTAVHVAGRQHLCLNARILRKAGAGSAASGGEMLNHYCREAMQYERSKQGRLDRRRWQQRAQQQGPLSASSAALHAVPDIEELESGGMRLGASGVEVEEDKGCVYCAESHLRALLEFLRGEQQAQQQADQAAAPSSPSTSIYSMERLRHLGNELHACPYIATRLLLRGADVAFIPYSYLLDEGQRAVLLGGVTTNPATAAEAEAMGMYSVDDLANDAPRVDAKEADNIVEAPPSSSLSASTSLGSVLYHRKQRVTATAAFHQRRKQQQQQQQQKAKSTRHDKDGAGAAESKLGGTDEDDDLWHVMARSAPPSFCGDILVFDEAHNIADHCRSTSTVQLSPWHLQLSEGLLQTYLSRYEARLLTRNKQRVRELLRFLHKLERFFSPTPPSAAAMSPVTSTASSPKVFPFHTFLFEAGIDNVDVYSLLLFLVDSQLLVKLQGFVGFCLDAEAKSAGEAMAKGQCTRLLSHGEYQTQQTELVAGAKRRRSNGAVDETQRQRRFLASLSSDGFTATEDDAPGNHTVSRSSSEAAVAPAAARPLTSLLSTHVLRGDGATLDPTRQRAVVTDALQRIERLLCALYVSDTTSTRLIWTPCQSESAEGGDGVVKLIQLEPGAHTFAPLAREARAVVLAGGTMQPLAFTCGPLLPVTRETNKSDASRHLTNAPSTTQSAIHCQCQRESRANGHVQKTSPDTRVCDMPLRLISEGHVVLPSAVRVFTLGMGPSKVRIELTQHILGSGDGGTASTSTGSSADRVLAEVGCTLLNLTRVLPPAGAICFFVSYDMMDRVVEVLKKTGYYDQINEVKRIFRESRGGKHGNTAPESGGSGGVSEMLQHYQSWIYGDAAGVPPNSTKKACRGALLFAVMGGRLSEGINFADDLGRAVIVLGMPYANPTDVELQLNLHHIAQTRLRTCAPTQTTTTTRGASTMAAAAHNSPFTSAAEWGLYMDGMMRTVNQCIGRCIRHSGDYAAIILLDARYGERADVQRRVSAWLQPSIQVCHSFGECFSGIRTFFNAVTS